MEDEKSFLDKKYEYGFHDEDTSILDTGKGINEDVIRAISAYKHEPEWMLEFRLKAFRIFQKMPMPKFGPSLDFMDFDSYTYFTRVSKAEETSWDD
ncbi:MAG: Fe-S cluster assembly protein SufB, partial [Candidatus Enteromonas sp.]|nr:Fe-S cluster assembly protein SufB [Candidatus Enteromonas sp.]